MLTYSLISQSSCRYIFLVGVAESSLTHANEIKGDNDVDKDDDGDVSRAMTGHCKSD